MNKWIGLISLTTFLLLLGYLLQDTIVLHDSFFLIVAFFAIQSIVFIRIDHLAPKEWQSQVSLIKIIVRLLTSLIFITILIYTKEDQYNLVIQFIIVYLIYMIFEIVGSLTNLRRN
ncbi:MAG: hypothetical protein AAFY41_02625 [Bacteroidota bacterium]